MQPPRLWPRLSLDKNLTSLTVSRPRLWLLLKSNIWTKTYKSVIYGNILLAVIICFVPDTCRCWRPSLSVQVFLKGSENSSWHCLAINGLNKFSAIFLHFPFWFHKYWSSLDVPSSVACLAHWLIYSLIIEKTKLRENKFLLSFLKLNSCFCFSLTLFTHSLSQTVHH